MRACHEAKAKSVRPLKSKLAETEKRYRERSAEMRNCLDAAKKIGTAAVTAEFTEEANRISAEKRDLEHERVRIKAEINYLEGVAADTDVIANALLRFQKVVTTLPLEEQKELIQLIVREIVVKPYDPEKDPKAGERGIFKTRIRTKWYLVNISIFATDLIPSSYKVEEISSDLKGHGSRGRARTFNIAVNSRALYH